MISGMIITYNEANIIEKPIKSLQKFCDEVVILDSYSDDGTPLIAQNMGCRVYSYEFDNFRDQKNRAIELCKGDWIAILDADEWFNPRFIEQVYDWIKDAEKLNCNAINIPRYNIERGEKGVGWPDYQTRLIKPEVRHIGNPIHPAFNASGIMPIPSDNAYKEGRFIYQEKSYEKQEERYRCYHTVRAIDYKGMRNPDNLDITKSNYEDRPYLDIWTEWHRKERKFKEVREFK